MRVAKVNVLLSGSWVLLVPFFPFFPLRFLNSFSLGSSAMRRRRAFEKTRQCGESFLGGETAADVLWNVFCSLKDAQKGSVSHLKSLEAIFKAI